MAGRPTDSTMSNWIKPDNKFQKRVLDAMRYFGTLGYEKSTEPFLVSMGSNPNLHPGYQLLAEKEGVTFWRKR